MPADTSVKYFDSTFPGAPTLTNTAGSLIAVMDACLINGWGLLTASSLVVSAGVATMTFATGHSFTIDTIALVAGSTPSGLNGEKRLLSVTTNAITYDATGIADTTATGTITAKIAPLGWAKVFSGTNKAVYRSTDVSGSRLYLRIDDTGTTVARAIGYETMTDVDTGTGLFPTTAQLSGGVYWNKAMAGANRLWSVFGDSRLFYLHTGSHATYPNNGIFHGFGDPVQYKSGDAYGCLISGTNSDKSGTSGVITECLSYSAIAAQSPGLFFARASTQLGGAVQGAKAAALATNAAAYSGGTSQTVAYPNTADNGLIVSSVELFEGTLSVLRGRAPGLYFCPQNVSSAFSRGDRVTGIDTLPGRTLRATPAGNSSVSLVFVDITGPWSR